MQGLWLEQTQEMGSLTQASMLTPGPRPVAHFFRPHGPPGSLPPVSFQRVQTSPPPHKQTGPLKGRFWWAPGIEEASGRCALKDELHAERTAEETLRASETCPIGPQGVPGVAQGWAGDKRWDWRGHLGQIEWP